MSINNKILFLILGSRNQTQGGLREYERGSSILSRLPDTSAEQLLAMRRHAFEWLRSETTPFEGIPISQLAFNRNLVFGPDLGGLDEAGVYCPAWQRYEGRFFQTLGLDGLQSMLESQHDILLLGGLYGLLTLTEPVQRYNCPVRRNLPIFGIWTDQNNGSLTDVLLQYIRQHHVSRIFDLTATEQRRGLIDWSQVRRELPGNVLHCFSTIAAGDAALIAFARAAADYLLRHSPDELAAIEPGSINTKRSIVFQDSVVCIGGLPQEEELRQWTDEDDLDRKRRGVVRLVEALETQDPGFVGLKRRIENLYYFSKSIGQQEMQDMITVTEARNVEEYPKWNRRRAKISRPDVGKAWKRLEQSVNERGLNIEEFKPN